MKLFEKENNEILKDVKKNSSLTRHIKFVLGVLLISIAYNLFLANNELVPGGISGLAIIVNYLTNIENSVFILVVNIGLLVLSYLLLGKEQTIDNILGAILLPIFIYCTKNITEIITFDSSQLLLSTVFGGVLFGLGAGTVFKAGFTTGGTDILNLIISKYCHLSMGKSMLITDGLIVLSTIPTFGVTHFMYSIIVLYIISYMSDKVILGISDSKAFYIITDKDDEVKEFILKNLNHGVTIFKAKGGFNRENRNVLMCVLPTKEYYILKSGISQIDKDAFFVVTDSYEVFGGE